VVAVLAVGLIWLIDEGLDHLFDGFAHFISMIAGCVPILGTSQRARSL
jgi:hypothetical protein